MGVRGEKAHGGWLQPRYVGRRVGLEMGKRWRASAAPHEVFGGGFITYSSLVGDMRGDAPQALSCRYGFARKSVGSLHDGRGADELVRSLTDPLAAVLRPDFHGRFLTSY